MSGKRTSDVVLGIDLGTSGLRIPVAGLEPQGVLDAIRAGATGRVGTLDGVRVDYDDGWGLVRISVTEPILTFRFEARRKEDLPRIMDDFLGRVPEVAERVGTCFAEQVAEE